MTTAPEAHATQEIVVEEIFPHAPSAIWKALTSGELINRWLMQQTGFAPEIGKNFSFQSRPSAEWDGVIHCQILELVPVERLSFSWKSGVQTDAGYVARLDTIVTWTLARHDNGTRLRLVHSGFELPKNEVQMKNISTGWPTIIPRLIAIVAEQTDS